MKITVPLGPVEVSAAGHSVFCIVLLLCANFAGSLNGQLRNPVPVPSGPGVEKVEGVAGASSYRLEWKRHFEFQSGLVPVGTADDAGTLWLITHAGPGKPEEFLIRIEPEGRLSGKFDPKLPLKPIEWVSYLSPATSGQRVGLLASIASGGQRQTFEGAFFLPMGADGLGTARRIAGPGPQFPKLVGNGTGQFIAAGDQEPLTLLKLDANGALLWRRSFSRNLVLPDVAVGPNGNTFVLSDGAGYILIQVLDEMGRLLRSKRITAKQGTVATDANSGCSILFSKGVGGKENRVYLSTLDQTMHQSDEVETPLRGRGGRTYQLISTPRGHLAVGEGPEQQQQILAEFDGSGRLIWQHAISGIFTPLMVPFKAGFYVVRDVSEGKGMDVEKYIY
jgi:hypothetical protein